jgi:hypothetical protein
MADVFVERTFEAPPSEQSVLAMIDASAGCMSMHRVQWQGSCLAADGRRMICRMAAVDAESVRIALRQAGQAFDAVWAGTVHDAPQKVEANVVVERSFDEPVTVEEIQAIEDAGAWCLETHRVKFARTFFSSDRKRMICLYGAADAESVRLAQRQAKMPLDRVWQFRGIHADKAGSSAA